MLREPLMRAMTTAIRREDAAAGLVADARSFLKDAGLRGRALTALSGERAAARLLVYRSLVHGRFRGAIEATLPRTVALLGAQRLDAEIAAFLHARASRSPYLRDVAAELVVWAAARWAADPELPAHLLDLARHELLWLDVAAALDDEDADVRPDLSLDARLVFQGAAVVARYGFAVHRATGEAVSDLAPAPGPVAVLVYRDREQDVRCLELPPIAAEILQRLVRDRATLRSAVVDGCAAAGAEADGDVLAGTVALLTDLAERGVLLGGAP